MGFDERGHCPMLVDDRCTIYEHRPRTCRNYDCRVFPAAGLSPDDDDKALITEQVRRWKFDFGRPLDRVTHDAVRAAVVFVRTHALPDGKASSSSTLAMSAIKAHRAFLEHDETSGSAHLVAPDLGTVRAALRR